ncbi:hypothetical protein QF004_000974 [Chryseobacterium sp. MDT2-18]|nr:hypothetical protein [Chryseobacterium sp. MDT2-18]
MRNEICPFVSDSVIREFNPEIGRGRSAHYQLELDG